MEPQNKKIILASILVAILILTIIVGIYLLRSVKNDSASALPAPVEQARPVLSADEKLENDLAELDKLRSPQAPEQQAQEEPQVVQAQLEELDKLRSQNSPSAVEQPKPEEIAEQLKQLDSLRATTK